MRHGLLAWRAPSGPEVEQQDLTSLVLNFSLTLFKDLVCLLYDSHLGTNTVASRNLDFLFPYVLQNLGDFRFNGISFLLLVVGAFALNLDDHLLLLHTLIENVNALCVDRWVLQPGWVAVLRVDFGKLCH